MKTSQKLAFPPLPLCYLVPKDAARGSCAWSEEEEGNLHAARQQPELPAGQVPLLPLHL